MIIIPCKHKRSRRWPRKYLLSDIFVYQPAFCLSILYFELTLVPNLFLNRKKTCAIYFSEPSLDENLCVMFCIALQVVGGLVMLCYGGRCCSRCSASFIVLSFLFGLGHSNKQPNKVIFLALSVC